MPVRRQSRRNEFRNAIPPMQNPGAVRYLVFAVGLLDVKANLEKKESGIAASVKVIEEALMLAKDGVKMYDRAKPELRAMLLRAFFERIEVKDGAIVRAVLNQPLDYIFRDLPRIKNNPVIFDGVALGRP